MEHPAQIVEILHGGRLVQTQLTTHLFDLFRGGALPRGHLSFVAGNHLGHGEDDGGQSDQGEDRCAEFTAEKRCRRHGTM